MLELVGKSVSLPKGVCVSESIWNELQMLDMAVLQARPPDRLFGIPCEKSAVLNDTGEYFAAKEVDFGGGRFLLIYRTDEKPEK
jgi:hypothetical protein